MSKQRPFFATFVADVRKTDVTPFARFVAQRIRSALQDEGLPAQTFGSLDEGRITLGRTASRSFPGSMDDIASTFLPHRLQSAIVRRRRGRMES